jgi:hypothetical protein
LDGGVVEDAMAQKRPILHQAKHERIPPSVFSRFWAAPLAGRP